MNFYAMLNLKKHLAKALSHLSRASFLTLGVPLPQKSAPQVLGQPGRKALRREDVPELIEAWLEGGRRLKWDFALEELCLSADLPKRVVTDYFHTTIRKDFRTWKAEKRVAFAAAMMRKDDTLPISKVAEEVGFKDRSNFHRQFKRVYHCTPRRWRDGLYADSSLNAQSDELIHNF